MHILQELKQRIETSGQPSTDCLLAFEAEQGAHCTVNTAGYKTGASAAPSYNITADSIEQGQMGPLPAPVAGVLEPSTSLEADLGAFDARQHKSLLVRNFSTNATALTRTCASNTSGLASLVMLP